MSENKINEFSVQIYGDVVPFNQVASKARVRIFYKGKNRNGSFITDQFADQLISSLPYVPVKGIYLSEEGDYSSHGLTNEEGKIYGIVPENPHFAWETHLDTDGIEREYACADIILFTSLYEEASEILGKSQSMELYADSIKGDWQIIDGQRYFVFTDGCFLGLQVLGDKIEPCFEGAAFYELVSSFSRIIQSLNELTQSEGGELEMEKLNFKLSDSEKYDLLFMAMNPNYTEENGWEINFMISEVYDDYFIAYNLEENETLKVSYTKNEEGVELTGQEKVFAEYVSEAELNSLEIIRNLNGGTYENTSDVFAAGQSHEETVEKYEAEKLEFENTIATLTSEKEELTTSFENTSKEMEELKDSLLALNSELEELKEYKFKVEMSEKEAILGKYAAHLNSEVVDSYKEHLEEMSVEELDRELAYALVKNTPSIFSNSKEENKIPKSEHKTGIEGILDNYK